jgi:hypothetical protein
LPLFSPNAGEEGWGGTRTLGGTVIATGVPLN